MIALFNEMETLRVEIDRKTQVNKILKTLQIISSSLSSIIL